eukprot:maker-scaffold430_size173499-snap-gene-0.51 protein:Tk07000 transcript:maker-scaffold430_size173499-snap-gene-0.51-mRNA-1 annotation:"PREDICTED: girdin-like"
MCPRFQNLELTQDARAAKTLRDELDIVRERAEKVDKLEAEMQRYKDKVDDLGYFKSRADELQEDNKTLVETKSILEEQLTKFRKRTDQILSLENEILHYKSELNKVHLDRESDKQRMDALSEENYALQMSTKGSFSESQSLMAEMQVLKDRGGKDTNILTEQMGHDVTRIHRLELENQQLLSQLEDAKVDGFHKSSEKILELEKQNKKYSITIKQLMQEKAKDEQCHVQLEAEVSQAKSKIKELDTVVSTLESGKDILCIEKDTQIENLCVQVDSLRKRQEASQNEQSRFLGDENRKLIQERTQLQTQVSKVCHENDRYMNRIKDMQAHLEQVDELKLEKEKLNSQLEGIMKETEDLRSLKDSYESSTDSFEKTRDENDRLNKSMDKLKTDNHNFIMDNAKLKSDVAKLNRRNESLNLESQRIQSLEGEREDLKDTINKMRINMDALEAAARKGDEQENKLSSITLERNRLQRQLESTQKKLDKLSQEHEGLESKNKTLTVTIDSMKTSSRNVKKLEMELVELEVNHDKVQREHWSLSRELERLKHSNSLKETTLVTLNSEVDVLQRERDSLKGEMESWKANADKIESMKIENMKLRQDGSMDKRSLVKLREELVREKLRSEDLANQLEELNKQLHKLGIDQNILNGKDQLISMERINSLEGSMDQLMETKQKKINALETKLGASLKEKAEIEQRVELLTMQVAAGDSKAGLEAQLTKVIKEKDRSQSELLTLKMEASSNEEKITLYEGKIKTLHENMVNIQVENSTLQSQSSSLLSQINQLQMSQSSLESAKRKAEENERRMQGEREDLLQDQAGLQKLHDSLQQDYDQLLRERDTQKDSEKTLRMELRALQSVSVNLREDQDYLLKAKEAIDMERESLRADARTLANLRSEHARLKDDFRSLFTSNERVKGEYCSLQTDYKALKTSYNQLKLQHTDFKGQLDEARSQLTQLDTLDDKEHFHEEERTYTDKMNHLSRQKEKLEEKIMEQYRKMDNSPQKKMGLGGHFVQKIRKYSILAGNRSTSQSSSSSSKIRPITSAAGTLSANASTSRARSNSRGRSALDDGQDSSSVGSGCNDSLDSGSHSPRLEPITRSESAHELRRRESRNSPLSSVIQVPAHLTIPVHLEEDSDGNNADNDSVNSLTSGASFLTGHIDRYGESGEPIQNQSYSSHSEIGIPVTTKTRSSAPAVPARKPSRNAKDAPPQRPPKPGPGSSIVGRHPLDDNRYQDTTDDSSTIDEDPVKQENTEWYEYGCV